MWIVNWSLNSDLKFFSFIISIIESAFQIVLKKGKQPIINSQNADYCGPFLLQLSQAYQFLQANKQILNHAISQPQYQAPHLMWQQAITQFISPWRLQTVRTLSLFNKIVNTMRLAFSKSLYTISGCTAVTGTTVTSCSADSSTGYVAITPTVKTSGTTYQVKVTVKNPNSVQDISGINCYVLSSSNSILETTKFSTGTTSFELVTGTITTASITAAVNSAGTKSTTWTLTATLTNGITTRGKLVMTFDTQTLKYASLGENVLNKIWAVTSSSKVTCKYNAATLICDSSVVQNTANSVLTINVYPSINLAAGSSLQFIISNCNNPLSLRPYTGVQINTYDYTNPIDKMTTGISLTAASLQTSATSAQAYIYNDKTLINQNGAEYYFQVTNINPIPMGGYLVITVPAEITTFNNIGSWTFTLNGETISKAAFTRTGQVITIKNVFSYYVVGGSSLYFTVKGWTNPSVNTAVTFKIQTYEDSSGTAYEIEAFTNLQIQAAAGSLYIQRLEPSSNKRLLEYASEYVFQIQITTQITSAHWLELNFPSDFQVATSAKCVVSGLYNSDYTCTSTATNRKVTIKDFTTSTVSANSVLSFTLGPNIIRNPGHFNATNPITINHMATTGVVSTGQYSFSANSFVKGYVILFTSYSSSNQTGDKGVSYTFTVKPQGWLVLGTYLKLYLPTDISIYDSNAIELDCGGTISGFSSSVIHCSVRDSTIIIDRGYLEQGSLTDPPVIKFTIPSLNNPRSTTPTKAFGLNIYDSQDRVIFYWNSTTSPSISMKTTGSPQAFKINPGSALNSAQTTYTFSVTPSLYYSTGDKIQIVAPSPIVFSPNSQCVGVKTVSSNLQCEISSDYSTVTVTLKTSRRRYLTDISSGTEIAFNITGVTNAFSTRPTSDGFKMYATTSSDYTIESYTSTTGTKITNSLPAPLSPLKVNAMPDNFIQSTAATYTFQFVPIGYEKGLTLKIIIPSQINATGSLNCSGIHGVDTKSLTCIYNSTERSIIISNGFKIRESIPQNITFTIAKLTNPSIRVMTESFKIQTYTSDGYLIDSLTSGMEVNFQCVYPCKTCPTNNYTTCQSCYSFVTEKSFFQNSCVETCPAGYFNDVSTNNCTGCQSPCLTCSSDNGLCTSCISKYDLLSDGRCYRKADIANIYPYPFTVGAIALSLIVLLTKFFARPTKFLQSTISMIAIPEIGAWGVEVYMLYMYGQSFFIFALAAGGLLIHIILNIIYSVLHNTVIYRQSVEYHLNFYANHRPCNVCEQVSSILFSFKFHILHLSYCADGEHLKGHWSKRQWCVYNVFVLVYFISSLALFVFAIFLQITASLANDAVGTFTWYITLDCGFIVAYMAILLLVLVIIHLPCCKHREGAELLSYNAVADDSMANPDDQLLDKDIGDPLDRRNAKLQDEDDIGLVARHRRKDTDVATPREKATQQEIQILEKYMDKLRQEGLPLDPNLQKEMAQKRKSLLEEEKLPSRRESSDIEAFQLREDRRQLEEEKRKLEDLKSNFLDEIDKRINQRFEKWEQGSVVSARQEPAYKSSFYEPTPRLENPFLIENQNPLEQTQKPDRIPTPPPSPKLQLPRLRAVKESMAGYMESRPIYDAMIEPIKGNKAAFEKVRVDEREVSRREITIGKSVKPILQHLEMQVQQDDQQDTEDDMEEIKMEEEQIRPASPQVDDEEERDQVDENAIQRKEKVLYSDKSESSIDEMMEDTPSNYNIPNGRLDGKSLGLKALLLHAKKQGIKLDVTNSNDGNQQVSLGGSGPNSARLAQPNSSSQTQLKMLTPQGLLGKAQRSSQEEEKQFINNLFRGGSDHLQSNQSQPNMLANSASQGRNIGMTGGGTNSQNQYQQQQYNFRNNTFGDAGDSAENLEEQKIGGGRKKKKLTNVKQFKEPGDDEDDAAGTMSGRLISAQQQKNVGGTQRSTGQANQLNGLGKVRSNNFV